MTKKEKQFLGETSIKLYLEQLGHKVKGLNIRKHPFEFDIVSVHKALIHVTEVRATSNSRVEYNLLFSKRKALTLIRGASRHYPEAYIQIAFVQIKQREITNIELYPIALFL